MLPILDTHALIYIGITIIVVLFAIATFFFVVTRGALLVRKWFHIKESPSTHVYPVYSEMWLIKLIDMQPFISAILLFQYKKLVDRMITELRRSSLTQKSVLITSCAFGNVIPRLVHASLEQDAKRIIVADIIENELTHAAQKLGSDATKAEWSKEDATRLKQENDSIDINTIFFLLHELPPHKQEEVLNEAARVLRSGGKLILAEFHRPDQWWLRCLSWCYFTVFEPYGLALWERHDPVTYLEQTNAWTCERDTYLFGNFQVIVATKK